MLDAPEGQDYTPAPSDAPQDSISPASPKDASAAAPENPQRRLLLVSLGDEVVGVPADRVVEVMTARPYAPIPGTAETVAGLVNRRGRILTVVDLGIAMGSPSTSALADHRIVVVSFLAKELGLSVKDVLLITEDRWGGFGEGGSEDPGTAEPPAGEAGEEHLRVVDLEELLLPLFGSGVPDADEPTL